MKDSGVSRLRPKRSWCPVVGSSRGNDRIKSVPTSRDVDIFISRLHPQTSIAEIEDCVHVIKGDK